MIATSHGCSKNLDDELKENKIFPDVQLKEFSLINQKLNLERTMSESGKPFLKTSNQKQKHSRTRTDV